MSEIRLATLADAAAIAKVQIDTWRATYRGILSDQQLDSLSYEQREGRWLANLQKPQARTFVCVVGGEVVGYSGAGRNRGPESFAGELYALYVRPEHQRHGLGRDLLQVAMDELRQLGLRSMIAWVLRDNPACAFYEKMGGVRGGSKTITEGGRQVEEVSYGWAVI